MREIRSSGSVGEPVGNRRLYPEVQPCLLLAPCWLLPATCLPAAHCPPRCPLTAARCPLIVPSPQSPAASPQSPVLSIPLSLDVK
jgi:hypothetical protein